MIKHLHIVYGFLGLVLFIWLGLFNSDEFKFVSLISVFNFVAYFIVLNAFSKGFKGDYKWNLIVIFIVYSFIFVLINNILSLHYSNNYFVFSETDAAYYHNEAIKIANSSLLGGFENYLSKLQFDDFGAVFLLSLLYFLFQSNIILNVFYILLSSITLLFMYDLCRYFMSDKLSALASFSFMGSSFMIFFYSSGLKEPVMIFLVISFFLAVQKYRYHKNSNYLLLIVLIPGFLFFYRPVLGMFCYLSVSLGFVLDNYKSKKSILVISIAVIVLILGVPIIERVISRFLASGDVLRLYEYRMATIEGGGSLSFLFLTNIISQYFGPLPTFSTSYSNVLVLYSSGLLYRVLISIPFFLGVFLIIKNKKKDLYPILFYILFEMNALIVILDGYELRFALPHIPLIFIIAFYSLQKLKDNYNLLGKWRQLFPFTFLIPIILIVFWNLR